MQIVWPSDTKNSFIQTERIEHKYVCRSTRLYMNTEPVMCLPVFIIFLLEEHSCSSE